MMDLQGEGVRLGVYETMEDNALSWFCDSGVFLVTDNEDYSEWCRVPQKYRHDDVLMSQGYLGVAGTRDH
jgi:hypothetical protein